MSSPHEAKTVDLLRKAGFEVFHRAELSPREAVLIPLPKGLHPDLAQAVESQYPGGLFSHQSRAIGALLGSADVCLSTATASGKSLVFIITAVNAILQNRSTKVVALYPAKALIQDQVRQWEALTNPYGISIGCIDGSVPTSERIGILKSSSVVLMTPDVAHAWLISRLSDPDIANFFSALRLLILDEAHTYDGAFGTNMAYLLRRLQVAGGTFQIIASTATLGAPDEFIRLLTGRTPQTFGPDEDGSGSPNKLILACREMRGRTFESAAALIGELADSSPTRFLAFADSRKMVERIVAASYRDQKEDPAETVHRDTREHFGNKSVLPFRAGYEAQDRSAIQAALRSGDLKGVVSTSAMELGLDIGEIDLVVMLTLPPSMKAFWQRLGRTGRRRPGICILIDDRNVLAGDKKAVNAFLERPLEPNWLYLENRYIQFANALCAAQEIKEKGVSPFNESPYDSLPQSFRRFLENELNPTESIAPDLYPLKQRAQAGPHREFPIRSAMEQNFFIKNSMGQSFGTLTLAQALREAYPGAIYYHMARAYRVYGFSFRRGEILVRSEKYGSTKPISQTIVFPRFQGGVLKLALSKKGFVSEVEMQVSERVLGFTDIRGSKKEEHRYGPSSSYFQTELNRFFETTGVCWSFPDKISKSDVVVNRLLEAFCLEFGVQERDLGIGLFHARQTPLGAEPLQGACIYDATSGSLRLTQRLAEHFPRVLKLAIDLERAQEGPALQNLIMLRGFVVDLDLTTVRSGPDETLVLSEDWVELIGPGQKGIYVDGGESREVDVLNYRYTPLGLMYQLGHPVPGTTMMVPASKVNPIYGLTELIRVNLVTGVVEPRHPS